MAGEELNQIIQGNCLEKLKELEDSSFDLMVTDPPYGVSFMGKSWDKAVPSVDIWKECLRVLKPGAFAFICCIPRQDCLSRMIINLNDAKFRTDFTSIYWTYATGFPKGMNIGKKEESLKGAYGGFQPKPAVEIIIVVMKPLSKKTYIDQALENNKGVTWLDDCRIPYKIRFTGEILPPENGWNENEVRRTDFNQSQGRFPANLLVSDDILNDGKITKSSGGQSNNQFREIHNIYGNGIENKQKVNPGLGDSGSFSRYFDLDAWWDTFPFAVVPKASKSERNKGCEKLEEKNSKLLNNHPTVKPIKLISYLITLGSRENDIVLDPFCGSGTTCVAADLLNRKYIGIELEQEYVTISEARIEGWGKPGIPKKEKEDTEQQYLF
ncbi:MAG: site-specific DNA-methyltransferase [Phycisphaerae bacterium]|jgi:site-specific DNA-methyltransferase (adenine-specific)